MAMTRRARRLAAYGLAATAKLVAVGGGRALAQTDPTLPQPTLPSPPSGLQPTVPAPNQPVPLPQPPAGGSQAAPIPQPTLSIAASCHTSDAQIVRQTDMVNPATGQHNGTVSLWYSNRCNKTAAQYDNGFTPACESGVDFCGSAFVEDPQNNPQVRCDSANGAHGCKTSFVGHNTKQHAHAFYTNGPYDFVGDTTGF